MTAYTVEWTLGVVLVMAVIEFFVLIIYIITRPDSR